MRQTALAGLPRCGVAGWSSRSDRGQGGPNHHYQSVAICWRAPHHVNARPPRRRPGALVDWDPPHRCTGKNASVRWARISHRTLFNHNNRSDLPAADRGPTPKGHLASNNHLYLMNPCKRSMASARRSAGWVRAMRKYPSPCSPYMEPGIIHTEMASKTSKHQSLETFTPSGKGAHT